MRETPNLRAIWPAVCSLGRTVLFRLNTGKAWVSGAGPVKRMPDGTVLVPAARPVTLGFGLMSGGSVVGAADLIGWHSLEITPAMVGCRVAVFVSVEAKRPTNGVATEDQIRWMGLVRDDGGIAVIANTPAVAQDAVKNFTPPLVVRAQNRQP